MTYRVFRRAWWRKQNGKIVPNSGGRKTTIGYAETEEEAQRMCSEYNADAPKCWRSIKAEYTTC